MATEKATTTTATQNPAPAPAKARTPRAKTLSTPTDAASTTPSTAAPRKSRAKAAAKPKGSAGTAARATKLSAQAISESPANIEGALLEAEASKSLQETSTSKPACKAHCGQCGREMRFVPFTLSNLMCRSCYGLDRYRRPTSPSLSSLTAPRPSGPR